MNQQEFLRGKREKVEDRIPAINRDLFRLLVRFEGIRFKAYQDPGGVWTVGVGHVLKHEEMETTRITGYEYSVDEVARFFKADLVKAMGRCDDDVMAASSGRQRQAILSITWNVGSIKGTILGARLKEYAKDLTTRRAVIAEWVTYDMLHGHEVKGLLLRRLDEARLWVSGT